MTRQREQRDTGREQATVGAPERARQAAATIAALCALSIGGCVQVLDTNASVGSPEPPPEPESDAGLSTVILPGPPPFGFYDNTGNVVTSEDPCEATRTQTRAILDNYCGSCHGGRTPGERAGNPPFDFLFDVPKLTSTWTNNTMPPTLFVSPGDPDRSRLYTRARRGEMPPPAQTELPRPTISDLSVLREWVSNCLGAKPPPPATGGGSGGSNSGASTTGGNGGASTTGGSGGASTTGGSGGASTTGGSGGASTTGGGGAGGSTGSDDDGGSGSGMGGNAVDAAGGGSTDSGAGLRDGGGRGGRRGG